MSLVFPCGTRSGNRQEYHLSGKQVNNTISYEQMLVQLEEDQAHQCQIFLHQEQGRSEIGSIKYDSMDRMWSNILTKLKQGLGFQVNTAHLMNIPESHDNKAERIATHHMFLPRRKVMGLNYANAKVPMQIACTVTV